LIDDDPDMVAYLMHLLKKEGMHAEAVPAEKCGIDSAIADHMVFRTQTESA